METPNIAHAEAAVEAHHHEPQSFWTKYVFSQDHKVIAMQYMITALVMGFIGMVMSWLFRIQLAWPDHNLPFLRFLMPTNMESGTLQTPGYYMLVTMHGTIMIFFLLTAILTGGFGNFLIPLQVGARDMAFPFLNMLSYWFYFLSCVVVTISLFVSTGAASGGWTSYPPLSALAKATPGSGLGQDLWLVSIALFIVASTMGSLNYVTTALNMRAKGMTLMRMPLTVWGIIVAAVLGLFAFPALFAGAVLLLLDRHLGTSFFLPHLVLGGEHIVRDGGSPLLWQHLFWFLGHPEVYILILPAMGITSEILSNGARKPIFGYKVMVASLVAIAFLSFIVWGHHMFVSGMNPWLGFAFVITTLIIAIPSAIKTFNWLGTLWKGNIRFTTPMLYAIGFISTFVTGGLTGLFLGNSALDIPLHDTYFVVAHFHVVMGLSSVFGIFAGIYYWFPKMTGKMMSERWGKVHFWLTFIGSYGVFWTMHYLGFMGMPRRYYSYDSYQFLPPSMHTLQMIITISALIVGAAQFIFIVNFLGSWLRGKKAPDNPWQANSLEWQAPTPPPHGNWGPKLPEVHRWPYDYSVPGASADFVPQTVPVEVEPSGEHHSAAVAVNGHGHTNGHGNGHHA
ncbi:MAG: cbb3-type cytochrome c oxidase subunit I [Chlorobi bacterium]|nr:cbb3-type cytochrome c oxidase subunit I [Chlorobiota bacterium]